VGNADLEFEIADIDFPAAKFTVTPSDGTVQPNDSQIITLTYDFNYAKIQEDTGSFMILSNDVENPEVEISLYAYVIVGINELQVTSNELRVFPNPTNGQLKIENGELKIDNVEIFDVMGRLYDVETLRATSLQSTPATLDISHLPAGVYFLRIECRDAINRVRTMKFIKQ
jgi:hypothetical protein